VLIFFNGTNDAPFRFRGSLRKATKPGWTIIPENPEFTRYICRFISSILVKQQNQMLSFSTTLSTSTQISIQNFSNRLKSNNIEQKLTTMLYQGVTACYLAVADS